jgi:hypothetical protein
MRCAHLPLQALAEELAAIPFDHESPCNELSRPYQDDVSKASRGRSPAGTTARRWMEAARCSFWPKGQSPLTEFSNAELIRYLGNTTSPEGIALTNGSGPRTL